MKNTFIIFLFLVFAKNAKADLLLSTFNLKNINTSNNSFLVNNLHKPTNIEFDVTIFKIGANQPGYCYITLLYTESPEDSNYENHPSTIELSSTKYITNSDYNVGPVGHQSIYAVAGLPAVLPAYSFSGRIVLKYRFFSTSKNEEVTRYSTAKFQVTIPPSTISNDNYTGAINISSLAIEGNTQLATPSQQIEPACGTGVDDDVWYKFTATSTSHMISLNDVSFQFTGNQFGTPLSGIALYDSSLNYLDCDNANQKYTATSLIIGETYFVRLWTASEHDNVRMTYKIAVSTPGINSVTNIIRNGFLFTADFTHDPTIPISDITIEWSLVPPAIGEADHFGISMNPWNNNPHQVYLTSTDGDVATRIAARLKRISTGDPISIWFTRNSLIWFDPPMEEN